MSWISCLLKPAIIPSLLTSSNTDESKELSFLFSLAFAKWYKILDFAEGINLFNPSFK